MSIEKSKLLLINSHDRTSGSNTDFSIDISNQLTLENVVGISVKSISCEHGFYNVAGENQLLRYQDGDSGLVETVLLPLGQYDVDTFMTMLVAEFQSQKGITLSIALNENDYRLTIDSPSKSIGWLTERSRPVSNPAGDLLGITEELAPQIGPQVMPSPVNLLGPQTIYIMSNALALGQGIRTGSTGGQSASILDAFSVAGYEWGTLVHTRSQDLSIDGVVYGKPRTLKSVDIKLVGVRSNQALVMPESFHIELLLRVFYK